MAFVLEYSFGLIVDEIENQFDECLTFAGYAGGRTPGNPPDKTQTDKPQQNGDRYGIQMQRPKTAITHLFAKKGKVVIDVIGGIQFWSGSHEFYLLIIFIAYEKCRRKYQHCHNKCANQTARYDLIVGGKNYP